VNRIFLALLSLNPSTTSYKTIVDSYMSITIHSVHAGRNLGIITAHTDRWCCFLVRPPIICAYMGVNPILSRVSVHLDSLV
jgi:hypothetical protein